MLSGLVLITRGLDLLHYRAWTVAIVKSKLFDRITRIKELEINKLGFPRVQSCVVPPHPIPNWVVKRTYADGTSAAGLWESRETRGVFYFKGLALGYWQLAQSKNKAREVEDKNKKLQYNPIPCGAGGCEI